MLTGPRLVSQIHGRLKNNPNIHPKAFRVWNLILDFQSDGRNFIWDHAIFNIKDRVKKEGWSSFVLRDYDLAMAPMISYRSPVGIGKSKPPLDSWENVDGSEVAGWEVKFPDRHNQELDVPDEVLLPLFRIVERHFEKASTLMKDLGIPYYTTSTCYPEREVEGQDFDRNKTFIWFFDLFQRMIINCPETARALVISWPKNDKYFFSRLQLFAWNQSKLFDPNEAAENILAIHDSIFWDSELIRELLFLIKDCWESFSRVNKSEVAKRLLRGPDKMEHWSDEDYQIYRDESACRYIQWLVLQGIKLGTKDFISFEKMTSKIPGWNENRALCLTEKEFPFVRNVDIDETPDQLIGVPVSEVVMRVKALEQRDFRSFTEMRPFSGLVKSNPRKALASLTHESRKGEYPKELWSTLLDHWPEKTDSRLFNVLLLRLGRLPFDSIRDFRHSVGRWLSGRLTEVFQFDKNLAWDIFDHFVCGLVSGNGVATRSGIGNIRRGGKVQQSRRTLGHALNGPVGGAAQGLLNVLNLLNFNQGGGIPRAIKSRLESLIMAPGEGGDHAITILTWKMEQLNYLDSDWVKDRIIPLFAFECASSEPAWNGYLSASVLPSPEIGVELKPLFLNLFPKIYDWSWGQDLAMIASQMVTLLAVYEKDSLHGLASNEVRTCLRNMNDKNRQDVISKLSRIGKSQEDGWSKYVIPFIHEVWPRERKLRTSNLVSSWITLLNNTGEKFPDVLSVVRRYLVPQKNGRHGLYQFVREIGGEQNLTIRFPDEVLELLDAVVSNSIEDIPFELDQMLALIETAQSDLVGDRRFVRLTALIEQA